MSNVFRLFEDNARRLPGRVAVEVQREGGLETYDYAELLGMAERMAAGLVALGCARGGRCVLLAGNDAHWCAAYLALLRLGAVAVPLDTTYDPEQIRTVIEDSGATLAIVSLGFLPGLREAVAPASSPPGIVLLTGSAEGLPSLDEAPSGQDPARLPACPAAEEDTAVILYTSGTTSDPKGVVLTHGNLMAERDAALQVVDLTERDSILGILPLFHALAQLANLVLPLTIGARVVFLETVNTTGIMRALAERGLTAFCCVPQFYYLIHQRIMQKVSASPLPVRVLFRAMLALNGALRRWTGANLGRLLFRKAHQALGSNMRLLVSGGSRLDPEVGRTFCRLGFNLMQAYGLTECSGAATITRTGDARIDSVGPPMPGVEVRILAGDDQEPAGREKADGEILIRGPIVMKGYHDRPDANAETLRDGWLHTGDLGYFDTSGRLYVTGRKKEVIVLANGKNIYPEEIEAHYLQSPFIKDICVIGAARPGEPASERLHAIVVPDADELRGRKMVNTRETVRFEIEGLSIRLASHKRVLSFDIWQEELPRTTTRKLKRFEIERMHRERASVPAVAAERREWTEEEEIWAADPAVAGALAAIREAAKRGFNVTPDANLDLDLGFDSMERVELLTLLEHRFGTDVPPEVAHQIHTVRELVDAVRPRGDLAQGAEAGQIDPWERLLASVPDDPALKGVLKPKPILAPVAWLVMKSFGLAARFLFGLRASGKEHLPAEGPFLISPNHQSYLDAFVMVAALKFRTFKRLFFVGASEYFATPLMRWVASHLNIVPVDPDANLVRAMQAGAYGLRHGKVLVLFPEGERSPDGTVRRFKKGAAILSIQLGVPIVPAAIEGIFEVWPRNRPLNWKLLLPWSGARSHVRFGAPLTAELVADVSLEERYARMTERFREIVADMWAALHAERLK